MRLLLSDVQEVVMLTGPPEKLLTAPGVSELIYRLLPELICTLKESVAEVTANL